MAGFFCCIGSLVAPITSPSSKIRHHPTIPSKSKQILAIQIYFYETVLHRSISVEPPTQVRYTIQWKRLMF